MLGELEAITTVAQYGHRYLVGALAVAHAQAAAVELVARAGRDRPVGALIGPEAVERTRRVLDYGLTLRYGARYTNALCGVFPPDDDGFDLLADVVNCATNDERPDAPRNALAAGLWGALYGEWYDLLCDGAANDVTRQHEDDEDDAGDSADLPGAPGRGRGIVPKRTDDGLAAYPDVLREAVAVTVARLPYSSPATAALWSDAVQTVFMTLSDDDDDNDEENVDA